MNKDNIFKSSKFYMSNGDVLHIILDGETGDFVSISLMAGEEEEAGVSDVLTDIDGNTYPTIIIGNKQWMAENLKVITYADGTPIPNLPLIADWAAEDGSVGHDGAYCWYDNDAGNKDIYGAIYNWYTIQNVHGLAPSGWRVPTLEDYEDLVGALGGEAVAGGILKEIGTTYWLADNVGATNTSNFSALGGGYRHIALSFLYLQEIALFGIDVDAPAQPEGLTLYNNVAGCAFSYLSAKNGVSVRCVRDL